MSERSNSQLSYGLILYRVKMRILSSLISSLLVLTASASEITINNYDKEIYCPVKQSYDPSLFRQRTLDFLEKYIQENSQQLYVLNTSSLQDEYSTKAMNEIYQDERVLYLTQKGLKKYQVFYAQGKLYDMHHLPYQSRVPFNAAAGNGDMIVMDSLGNLFIHPKVRGVMHHSSFFSAAPLLFAGICSVERGNITNLLTYSGHHAPSKNESENLNAMLSLTPLCQALYKKVQKNNRDYLIYDSGLSEEWHPYQGILCDLKEYGNRDQKYYEFRLIDIYQGALLKKTQLRLPPGYKPQQIIREANGFAMLIEKQTQQAHQKNIKF